MTSLSGPHTGDPRARLEMEICKVKRTYKLIKPISASLLVRMRKDMVLSTVIIRIRS
jgi:hypothetical protein